MEYARLFPLLKLFPHVSSPFALQVREPREYDHHLLHQGVLLRQAGGGEGGDGVRPL